MSVQRLRLAAAALIFVSLGAICVRLLPSYLDNLEFQRSLERIVHSAESRTQPAGVLRAAIADEAARLGLPVRLDQVNVVRTADRLRVEVRYIVRVDLALYTVDLHFRPRAGS